MKRRDFLLTASAALAAGPVIAGNPNNLTYTPGLVAQELAAGKTLFLDFSATWCGTCKAQERVINALRAESPAYDQAITFIIVDWDEYGYSQLAFDLEIPRRSTLVALRGDEEIGRIVAGTGRNTIKALMDAALAAATA